MADDPYLIYQSNNTAEPKATEVTAIARTIIMNQKVAVFQKELDPVV